MPRALGITITAVIVTILRSYVSAQTPICLAGYTSLYNSLDQSPCTMAIALGGACNEGSFSLFPASATTVTYGGPYENETDSCDCSTVYYSVLSACAYCQGARILMWSEYAFNCSATYLSYFLEPIPSYTKIPRWAYLDVVANNTFDPVEAEIAGGLESSALLPPASSTLSTTSSTQTTGSSTTIVSSNSGGTKSKSNVGAIAGGVIGGLFLGIVAGLLTLIILRRRKPSGPSPSTSNSAASPATVMGYNPGYGPYGSYTGVPEL